LCVCVLVCPYRTGSSKPRPTTVCCMNLFIPSLPVSTVTAHKHISYCDNTLHTVLAACTVICQQYSTTKAHSLCPVYRRQLLQCVQCNGNGADIINCLVYCKMSAASHTVQQVPESAGTNCSNDSPTPKQVKKLIPINICRQTVTATVTVQQCLSCVV
jgi:hypothetical protein